VTLPGWLEGALTIIVLDLGNYLRHCLSHYVSVLWPLHRLHHTDDDIDFTTTLRSHPIDAVFNSATELGLIAVFGAAPMAFLVFHFFSRIVDFFSHANIQIPSQLDRIFRWVVVTPAMHRIHHSQRMRETNSNYGSLLSLWDRWFGTHVTEPMGGHDQMLYGLAEFSHPKHQTVPWMLAQPLLRVKSESPSR
jgi:sterol desaturase/sphingolipid hydroxylase (fatty acid hydroxylase superfamily)